MKDLSNIIVSFQRSFVVNCIIIDSAIFTFESFHVMKHMNDRTRMIGLKLDMSMAHDRIWRSFNGRQGVKDKVTPYPYTTGGTSVPLWRQRQCLSTNHFRLFSWVHQIILRALIDKKKSEKSRKTEHISSIPSFPPISNLTSTHNPHQLASRRCAVPPAAVLCLSFFPFSLVFLS